MAFARVDRGAYSGARRIALTFFRGSPWLALALAFGCSTATKSAAGLELIISTDLATPSDFDVLRLQISQRQDGGVWSSRWDQDYPVPGEKTLPATFAIAAGNSPDEEALVQVTALKLHTPIVLREALVQVPSDRVTDLPLVLAAVCRQKLTCPRGQSCQPGTGTCGSSAVDPAKWPAYVPTDLDAAGAVSSDADAALQDALTTAATVDDVNPVGPASGDETGSLDAACPIGTARCNGACLGEPTPCARTGAADANEESQTFARDACVPTGPEVCDNGIDDDCNGLTDCADRLSCSAWACAPKVPTGWVGPALLWTGPFPVAQVPVCPMGYQAIDAFEGLSAPNEQCSCACALSGQQCVATVNLNIDQTCGLAPCANITVPGTGACTVVPSPNNCGSSGSFAVTGTLSGGTCTAQVTSTNRGAPTWTSTVRVCAWVGATDSPGGCIAEGAQCVPSPAPFASQCVYHPGAVATCPVGYTASGPRVIYSGVADQRGCGPCTCSGPVGGSCSGTVRLYAGSICGGTGTQNAPLCTTYAMSPGPGSVRATYSLTPGSCSVASPAIPMGAAVPTGATTVCCL